MKIRRWLIPIILLAIWQGLCSTGLIQSYKLPSPYQVLVGFRDLLVNGMPPGQVLHWHILYSLQRVAVGFTGAVLIGVPLGIAMGASQKIQGYISPVIELVRPIPPLAWIPISILWFGIGLPSAGFIIFLGVFFPVVLNTITGVSSTNQTLVEAIKTLGATQKDIVVKVLIPNAIPNIFTGLRIGLGIGWMTLVAAEFTGVESGYGLGYMIMTARDIQKTNQIFAGMIVIGIIGLLLDTLLRQVQKHICAWQRA